MIAAVSVDTRLIPQELLEPEQWVVWKYVHKPGEPKPTKPLFQTNGYNASHSDPDTWTKFEQVLKAYERGGWDGIGFVLSDQDPYSAVDIDHAIDAETGEIAPWAQDIIKRLDSYTEISPSGTGIRIFLRGELPDGTGGRKQSYGTGAVEAYTRQRYLTVTGRRIHGEGVEERNEAFQSFCLEAFPKREKVKPQPKRASTGALDISDSELLRLMFASASGAAILRLWSGDVEAHGGPDKSHSGADQALCNYLVWWCGGDIDRADRLFRKSQLMRPKWDEMRGDATYGADTLGMAAAAMKDEGYQGIQPDLTFDLTTSLEPGTQDALEAAREIADGLAQQLREDIGYAFLPEVLNAFGLLRAVDLSAWERCRATLRKARVLITSVEKQVPPPSHYLPPPPKDALGEAYAGDQCPDCPTPTLIIPTPYSLSPTETQRHSVDENGKKTIRPIAFAPLVIEGRMRDEEERREFLRLAWRRPGSGWNYQVIDRAVAMTPVKLLEQASCGLPVAGDNAKDLAQYLHYLEAANYSSLRSARVSSHLGWQGDEGKLGFLWGRHLITPEGDVSEPIDLEKIHPRAWEAEWIGFRGLAAGDEQIADGYHRCGTIDGQMQIFKDIAKYPRVLMALYCSLTAPLLMIVGAPNPIIDWANRTSTGKTTALRLAASVWGKPDEKAADGALTSWESTRVGIERRCYVCSGLPVIVDDSKQATKPEIVASMLYEVSQGRGRGRGNIQGLAQTRTWRLPLLSSGESTLVSHTQDGGTRARVLEITGPPFGNDTEETRLTVEKANRDVLLHYGHIGPFFVSWLIRNRIRWPEWTAWYHERIEVLAGRVVNGVAARMAHTGAAIDLAAALIHECFESQGHPLPWECASPLSEMWERVVSDASMAAPEIRALQDLMSWAYSNSETFYGRRPNLNIMVDPIQPQGGWSGSWSNDAEWQTIAFLPTTLEKVLKQLGYEPSAIIAGWSERKWLLSEGHHRCRKVSLGGDNRVRMYVLSRNAVEEVDESAL